MIPYNDDCSWCRGKVEHVEHEEIAVEAPVFHRCDRCGAAGMVSVMIGDTQLTFCDHHYRFHQAKLEGYATIIFEESVHFVPAGV